MATALANVNATATQFQRATSSPAVGDVIFRDDFDEVLAEGWTWHNDDNFVAINRGYCSPCVGDAVYFDYEVDGDPRSSQGIRFPTDTTELYLRLVKENITFTALFSLDGETGTEVGHISRMLWPMKVGLSATNADQAEQEGDLIAKSDYFVIREVG